MRKNKIGTVFLVSALALAGIGFSYAGLTDVIDVYGSVSTATVEFTVEEYSGTWVLKVCCWDIEPYYPDWPDYEETWIPEEETLILRGFDEPTEAMIDLWLVGTGAEYSLQSWAYAAEGDIYDVDMTWFNIFPCVEYKADVIIHYSGSIPAHVQLSDLIWLVGEEYFGAYTTFEAYSYEYDESSDIWTKGDLIPLWPIQMHYCDYVGIEIKIHLEQDDSLQDKYGELMFNIDALQWNDDCDGTFPEKTLLLPDDILSAFYMYPGSGGMYPSYWDVTLSGIPGDPGDYNVENGVSYDGFCVSQFIVINPPGPYNVKLWSSLEYSSNPEFPWPGNHWPDYQWDWPCVNYILNHRTNYPTATFMDFQNAIWYFVDGGAEPSGIAATIKNDAMTNVEAWYSDYPQPGDRVAVLLQIVDANGQPLDIQHIFIDVDP